MKIESNIDEVLARFQSGIDQVPDVVHAELVKGADEMVDTLRQTTHKRSGHLAAAWHREGTAAVNLLPYAAERAPDPATAVPADMPARIERAVVNRLLE